jgi:hypothetical protein
MSSVYELIHSGLITTHGRLDSLLKQVEFQENEWLEFKASFIPEPPATKQLKKSLEWNVFKAFSSLANSQGGLLLIGINDYCQPVDILTQSGLDRDEFSRRFMESVIHPTNEVWSSYTNSRHTKWSLESRPFDAPHLKWVTLSDVEVLAVLVPRASTAIIVKKEFNNSVSKHIYYRTAGDIGQVKDEEYSSISEENLRLRLNKSVLLSVDSLCKRLEQKENSPFLDRVRLHNAELFKIVTADTYVIELNTTLYFPKDLNSSVAHLPSSNGNISHNTTANFSKCSKLYNKFIISGDSGRGKSTLLKAMCAERIKLGQSTDIHLYANLCDLDQRGIGFILTQNSTEIEWNEIRTRLDSGEISIYLDGINECPLEVIEKAEREISELLAYNRLNIYLTDRKSKNANKWGLPRLEVNPATAGQIKELTESIFENTDASEQYLAKFRDSPVGYLVLSNPFLLKISTWMFTRSEKIPESSAHIYKTFFEESYRQENDKLTRKGMALNSTFNQLLNFLSETAYRLKAEGRLTASHDLLTVVAKSYFPNDSFEYVLEHIEIPTVLSYQKKNGLKFAHESILDYFCAEHLVANSRAPITSNRFEQWNYPIAFSFELEKLPSPDFVKQCWELTPMLCAATFDDINLLKKLPLNVSNLWEAAFIKILKGDDIHEELESLVMIGRFPPKYQIPETIIDILGSSIFWYSLNRSQQGKEKRQRLIQYFTNGSIWVDVLRVVPESVLPESIKTNLSPVHRSILNGKCSFNKEDLLLVSVPELCLLMREKMISKEQFRSLWKDSLANSNPNELGTNTLLLYRTNDIKSSQFTAEQTYGLKNIAHDVRLSPRLLTKMIGDQLVETNSLVEDNNRLDSLIKRSSVLNLLRFTNKKVLKAANLSSLQKNDIINKVTSIGDYHHMVNCGLLKSSDFPKGFIDGDVPGFRKNKVESGELLNTYTHQTYLQDLQTQRDAEEYVRLSALSNEEKILRRLNSECRDSRNFNPGSGFHLRLLEHARESLSWSPEERNQLIELALSFFKQHSSKKSKKEYVREISKLKSELQTSSQKLN